MVGTQRAQLLVDRLDLGLEVVHRPQARVDGRSPGLRNVEALQQLTAGDAEQVSHRAWVTKRDERRVDAVLEHRAMLDQVQPEARQLALAPDRRVGQPDLGHQITLREHGQHPSIDLVGLARQRRQALDLGRIGDQHLPPELLQPVVHEPRPRHRLDHPAHRQTMRAGAPRQAAHAVRVRRRRPLLDDLPGLRQQAHVELLSTQIQSSVQHEDGPPRARSSMTR
jgi:hypothetical protein